GNGKILLKQGQAESRALAGKVVDVLLYEEELFGIERFEILVQNLLRQRVVDRRHLVVIMAQNFRTQVRRTGLLRGRFQLRYRRSRIECGTLGERRQEQGDP